MTQIIGIIKTDVETLDSTKVRYVQPGTQVLVGITFGNDETNEKYYVVCSEKSFIETSRALNAIVCRILSYKEKKGVTFIEAFNFYLASIDHFIRVQKSKKQLELINEKVDRIYKTL